MFFSQFPPPSIYTAFIPIALIGDRLRKSIHIPFKEIALLTMFSMLFLATKSTGQSSELIKTINNPLLTLQEQGFVQNMNNLPTIQDLRIVEMGYVGDWEEGGFLGFYIPDFESGYFKAEPTRVEFKDVDNYTWSGKIVDGSQTGHIILVSSTEGKGGLIQLDSSFYTNLPISGNKSALIRHNTAFYESLVCGNEHEPTGDGGNEICAEEYNECETIIDVLFLVTDEAQAFLDGLGHPFLGVLYMALASESVNTAFLLSDIPNKRVRTRSVPFEFEFDPDNSILTDNINLFNDMDAQNLRNRYKADVIVMLTNKNYLTPNGNPIYGIADTEPDDEFAYIIVEIPFILSPRWSYAHELAHICGARHNRDSNGGDDDTDVCSHGWAFVDNATSQRRTILAMTDLESGTWNQPGGRILHFSNPNINFNGIATGTVDDDNARTIRNTGCQVGAFRPSPELGLEILGSPLFCGFNEEPGPKTYTAGIIPAAPNLPGQPPYTYEWRLNISGIFDSSDPGTFLGNSSSVTINSYVSCPHFFLMLTVTGSQGASVNHLEKITTSLCAPCINQNSGLIEYPSDDTLLEWVKSENEGGTKMMLYPNPTTDRATLEFVLHEADKPVIFLSTMTGMLARQIHIDHLDAGMHRIDLSLDDIPPGAYQLTLLCNGYRASRLLNKIN